MAHTGLNYVAGSGRGVFRSGRLTPVLAMLFALLLVAGGFVPEAGAQTQIATESLPSVTAAVDDAPIWGNGVAVDSAYNVYVSDGFNHRLRKYDTAGTEVASVAGIDPTAVEVDGSGNVLVAESGGTVVNVYDPALPTAGAVIGTLTPPYPLYGVFAIAVDAAGSIYVADKPSGKIAVFSSAYAYTGDVNIYASLPSTAVVPAVTKPTSLAVSGGFLFVGDQPNVVDQGDTVRIMKVDLSNGLLTEVFGEPGIGTNYPALVGPSVYGFEEGKIATPAGLEVDGGGLLYVGDPAQYAVQAFSENGVYTGYVYDAANLIRTVNDIALTSDGHLYVSSLNTHEIAHFLISGGFEATPASLSFTTPGDDAAKQISVCNYDQTGGISVSTNAPPTWMTLSSTAGNPQTGIAIGAATGPGTPTCETIVVSVVPTAPPLNEFFNLVLTEAGSGFNKSVAVTFDVVGVGLVAQPDFISVNVEQDRPTPVCTPINVTVSDASPVPDPLNVSYNATWLTVTQTGPGAYDACVDVTGLLPTTEFDTITFTDPNEGTSGIAPDTVGTYLTVTAKNSFIDVSSNISTCFNITGPEWPTGSNPTFDPGTPAGDPHCVTGGSTWNGPAIFSGVYTVTMQPQVPYITPGPFNFTLAYGTTVPVNAFYAQTLIAAAMGPDSANTSAIQMFDLNFAAVGGPFTAFDGASVHYGARVAMGDVDGDLNDEIIVAKGENSTNNTEVKMFETNGTPLTGGNFVAFSSQYLSGARVAAGDFDGDGRDEVVVGSSGTRPLVRIYSYNGSAMVDTGVIFNPFASEYPNGAYGVNIAATDIDGDGDDELVTTLAGKDAPADGIKVWDMNVAGGMGSWTAVVNGWAPGQAILGSATEGGTAVATAGSLVAVASGAGGGLIELYDDLGALVCSASVSDGTTRQRSGIELSMGDIDIDGAMEIIVTLGANDSSDTKVYIYEEATTTCPLDTGFTQPLSPILAPALYGARTAVGQAE